MSTNSKVAKYHKRSTLLEKVKHFFFVKLFTVSLHSSVMMFCLSSLDSLCVIAVFAVEILSFMSVCNYLPLYQNGLNSTKFIFDRDTGGSRSHTIRACRSLWPFYSVFEY